MNITTMAAPTGADQKQCTSCKEALPFTEFRAVERDKDGLSYRCRACERAYDHQYRQKNRARIAEQRKAREDRFSNVVDNENLTRTCSWCEVEKPLPAFPRDKHSLCGRRATCPECMRAYDRRRGLAKKEARAAFQTVLETADEDRKTVLTTDADTTVEAIRLAFLKAGQA